MFCSLQEFLMHCYADVSECFSDVWGNWLGFSTGNTSVFFPQKNNGFIVPVIPKLAIPFWGKH